MGFNLAFLRLLFNTSPEVRTLGFYKASFISSSWKECPYISDYTLYMDLGHVGLACMKPPSIIHHVESCQMQGPRFHLVGTIQSI